MGTEVNLLDVQKGSVVAPAGCGKTELIAKTLGSLPSGAKPALVLTHTNAGASALQSRLQRNSVPPSNYRIATLDGWAMRAVSMFPQRSGYRPPEFSASPDYSRIRAASVALIESGDIHSLVAGTYSRLLVDEYQDCNLTQHRFVCALSQVIPTVVLGDPLQAIFDIAGNELVSWDVDVELDFPPAAALDIPWRWINAEARPLGEWLISARELLREGKSLDFKALPQYLEWVEVTGPKDIDSRLAAAAYRPRDGGTVLIVADSGDKASQQNIAKRTYGACTVEAVDLKDLIGFSHAFNIEGKNSLDVLLDYASKVMTKVDRPGIKKRVASLQSKRAVKGASRAEDAALSYLINPCFATAAGLLRALSLVDGARVFRPAIYYGILDTLERAERASSLVASALSVRDEQRYRMRPPPPRAVGSTLLLKGLEADVSVVLYPEKMNSRHLYVALTRGARRVIVCSKSPELVAPVA